MTVQRPMNGAEYIESLRDGREVYIYGEKVEDVTTHPSFRNSIRSVAMQYDALHDPKTKDILTTETDTGSGGYTHRFFKVNRTEEELLAARDAITEWSRMNYGFMGRSPDYKAAFLASLGDTPEVFEEYADNARKWYKKGQEEMPFIGHALVNPPVNRHKPIHESKDIFMRVEEETDEGIIVSGAKAVATGSVFTNYIFIGPGFVPIQEEEYAVSFFVPTGAPGLKIICRPSFENNAQGGGTPFDKPLSSRFDENDSVLVFDKVFIPWEDVLIYRDLEKINTFLLKLNFNNRSMLQSVTRAAVKMDFITGVFMKAVELAGTDQFRGVQVNIGEVVAWRNLLWTMSTAMVKDPEVTSSGVYLPNGTVPYTFRVINTMVWPKVADIIKQVVAGGLIVQPSSALDFQNPELRPFLDKYYQGSYDTDAVTRTKIIKLLWDSVLSEFGSRHELYEINYSGNYEDVRRQCLFNASANGDAAAMKGLVEKCMDDYDLDGWKSDTWVDSRDAVLETNA